MPKNIVLIGMMGAGKTTVGELLAKKLSFNLVEMDSLIEGRAQKSINEIFAEKGEKYFRSLETQLTQELGVLSHSIISTGGGIVKNPQNIYNLRKNSIVIYLKASINELYKRVSVEKCRPLLNTSNPLDVLTELLASREAEYKKADWIIITDNKDCEAIANEIIEKYYE